MVLFGLERLAHEQKLRIEAIVVDDASPDGTGAIAANLSLTLNGGLAVRVIHRPAKAGLSSALHEGALQAHGRHVLIMDADNSHDIAQVPAMLSAASSGADVVIGSRYVKGGQIPDWPIFRRLMSVGAIGIAKAFLGLDVRDPTSGYALFRRDLISPFPALLNPNAYKFLLEVLVRRRPERVIEVPIVFRDRQNGESKLTARQLVEYLRLVGSLARETRRSRRDLRKRAKLA